MSHSRRITKDQFYEMGGFSNTKTWRKMMIDGEWAYYMFID